MKRIARQVEDYLAYCEKVREMSATTLAMKRNVLGRMVQATGIRGMEELTNQRYNGWAAAELGRGISARSMNMYAAVVLALVRYCREMGVRVPLNTVLVQRLKEGTVRRQCYTAEEVARAVACAKVSGAAQVGLMIEVMFETGMRIAELQRLRVEDITGRRIKFIGKGHKPREVYITAELQKRLAAHIASSNGRANGDNNYAGGNGCNGYVWGKATQSHEPPTVATIRRWMQAVFAQAGLEGFYPHALRHAFATDLQRRGASVAEIKEMMGHANLATTERYLHGLDGQIAQLWDKYR